MRFRMLLLTLLALVTYTVAIGSEPTITEAAVLTSYVETLSKLTPSDSLAFVTEWLKAALSMFARFEESKLGYLKKMNQYLQDIIDARAPKTEL